MTWAIAAVVVAGAAWLLSRRHRLQRRHVSNRSPYHEAYLAFVTEIMNEPEIVQLLKSRAVFSPEGVTVVRVTAGEIKENAVRAIAAKIASDRVVRRKIVAFWAARHGIDRHTAMKRLTAIHDQIKGNDGKHGHPTAC